MKPDESFKRDITETFSEHSQDVTRISKMRLYWLNLYRQVPEYRNSSQTRLTDNRRRLHLRRRRWWGWERAISNRGAGDIHAFMHLRQAVGLGTFMHLCISALDIPKQAIPYHTTLHCMAYEALSCQTFILVPVWWPRGRGNAFTRGPLNWRCC